MHVNLQWHSYSRLFNRRPNVRFAIQENIRRAWPPNAPLAVKGNRRGQAKAIVLLALLVNTAMSLVQRHALIALVKSTLLGDQLHVTFASRSITTMSMVSAILAQRVHYALRTETLLRRA